MFLQDIYKKIVGFFNFNFNTFMYISLCMEIDFKNVVNGIVGVVCKFILLIKLIKKIVVDFTRMDFFQKGSIFKWYWFKNLC
jgi:hypothetical protein